MASTITSGTITNYGTYAPVSNTITGHTLVNYGTLTLSGNNLTIGNAGTVSLGAAQSLASLTIQSGGNLTHVANANLQTYTLALTVTGNMDVMAGGTVNLDGKGFSAGYGAGAGGFDNTAGAGAGYGGAGGRSQNVVSGGATYGSALAPVDMGSGGGSSNCGVDGGAGGGYGNISVGGTLTIDGGISANGVASGCRGGGGSGGTLNITTATIAGTTGSLKANGGGVADGRAGPGGGGRIKLGYTVDSFTGGIGNLIEQAGGHGRHLRQRRGRHDQLVT